MRFFAGWETIFKRCTGQLVRARIPVLLLVSVGVLAFLIGTHFPGHFTRGSSAQGSGRGAGGTVASAQVPATPADFCLPGDINCIIHNVSSALAAGVQSAFQPIVDGILKNPANIIYQTPLLTNDNDAQNQAIIALNGFCIKVVDLAFACLLILGGYNVMVGRHLSLPSSTVAEVFPRAVLVVMAVHFNLFFAGLFVSFENSLTLDVIHTAGLNMLTNLIAGHLLFQNVSLLAFLLVLILGIMTLILRVQMITRIALVALGLALAPLGLGCFLLPQTMRWGRLWLVTLSTSVMVQFIQVVALCLGGVFVTALAATSFVRLDKELAILFLIIGTLGLVLKIPGMLQTWALHPMMDTSGSGGGSGSHTSSQGNSTTMSSTTTATEETAGTGGGFMEGTMLAEEDGALLLMF